MSLFSDPEQALAWITRLVAIGVFLDAAEQLYCWREFRNEGALSWRWLRTSRAFALRKLVPRGLTDLIFEFPALIWLISFRGLAALVLIALPGQQWPATLALLLLFVIGSLLNLRAAAYGVDTPNRLSVVIVGALLLQRAAPGSNLVSEICLWFIAAQACVSYATAGVAKVFNQGWRRGAGLLNIARAATSGLPLRLARFFQSQQTLARVLTWSIIVMECAFPLVLLTKPPLSFLFLGWGLLFHLAIAALIGFNRFLWSWLAMYPALVYVTQT